MNQQGRHSRPSGEPERKRSRRPEPAPDTLEPAADLPDEPAAEPVTEPLEETAAAEKPRPAEGTVRKKKKKRPATGTASRGTATKSGASGNRKRKRRRKKKKKVLRTVLIVLLVLVLLIAAAIYFVGHRLYSKMGTAGVGAAVNPTAEATTEPHETQDTSTPEPVVTPEPSPTAEPMTEEEIAAAYEQELRSMMQEAAEEIAYSNDVYNVLLIGADGTSEEPERGDAMLLLSINRATKRIWITSLMRDTQVSLYTENGSFYGTGHLNWAIQWGGIGMLVATVQDTHNFAVHIDNYALVNFVDFAEIAGLLGPITVTITAREAKSMNTLVTQVCQMRDKALGLTKANATPRVYFPAEGGTLEISDGVQILAYCRERHAGIGNENHYGDTGRSYKQREVLEMMWHNVQNMSFRQQYEILETIMSIIHTDMSEGKCFQLLLSAPELLTYEIRTQQSPAIGAMIKTRDTNGLSIYNADWTVNRNLLRATIYGEEMTRAQLTSGWTGNRVYVGGVLDDDEQG